MRITERQKPLYLRVLRAPWLPLVLLAVVAAADTALHELTFSKSKTDIGIFGLIDWCGHVSTAGLVLLALIGWRWLGAHRVFTLAALIGSVAIDLDHIPLYSGVRSVAVDGGRPFTHSLVSVSILALIWLVSGRRWTVFGGLAVGVLLHFVRDIATGNGVSLLWPLINRAILVPYWIYAAVLIGLTLTAVIRVLLGRRRSSADEPAVRQFSADRA